jgi:hypothetical protein
MLGLKLWFLAVCGRCPKGYADVDVDVDNQYITICDGSFCVITSTHHLSIRKPGNQYYIAVSTSLDNDDTSPLAYGP